MAECPECKVSIDPQNSLELHINDPDEDYEASSFCSWDCLAQWAAWLCDSHLEPGPPPMVMSPRAKGILASAEGGVAEGAAVFLAATEEA